MKKFYIQADSDEWCGISVDLIVETPDHFDEENIRDNLKLLEFIDEAMYEYASAEDELSEGTWGFAVIEETTDPEIINCAAYPTITLE